MVYEIKEYIYKLSTYSRLRLRLTGPKALSHNKYQMKIQEIQFIEREKYDLLKLSKSHAALFFTTRRIFFFTFLKIITAMYII